jgi:hypothetical protein
MPNYWRCAGQCFSGQSCDEQPSLQPVRIVPVAGYDQLRVPPIRWVWHPHEHERLNTYLTQLSRGGLGLESDVRATWGTAPDGATARFLWCGGGPRLVFDGQVKFMPRVHGLFGGASASVPRNALQSECVRLRRGREGVAIRLRPRVSWRVRGDFVGTRFASE